MDIRLEQASSHLTCRASATFAELLQALTQPATADQLTQVLAAVPYPAFFWECRPATPATLSQPFESVCLNSPALARVQADWTPFAQHLTGGQPDEVRVFENLSGDTHLIAPCPSGAQSAHLAAFLRTGSAAQTRNLWKAVGETATTWLHTRPILWLSTSGLGVHWLHVRCDGQPKYYSHEPYRSLPT